MLSRRLTFGAALGALVVSLQSTAQAQYYDGCGSCGPVMAQPIAQCTPIQPVQQTCYQTVPITTYTREKQTVQVPTYETAYEDREYTEYRPVTRSKEVEVPTVSYQTVSELRTVNRDMGRWTTNYHPVAKCAPCQVDPRPGLIGWMNRTGYSMRTAFTPNYTTSRQYVPNVVACSVPYTRQVAVHGTRRVTVQETEMVAERKTQKVQVQKMVMKSQEVTVMRPQTAYRTVPIGTAMAYGSPYIGGSQMAYGYPIIENSSPEQLLLRHPIRSALNDQHSKKTVRIQTSPSSVPPVTMATLMEQGWKHRFAAMMTHLSSVLLRHDVPQRNPTTWLFRPSSAKKPHQKRQRQNQSPRKLLVGEPLENRVNAVSLRAASTDRRFLWLTPHEKSSSFLNCII